MFVEAKGRYQRLRVAAMSNAVDQLFAHDFAATMNFAAATATCSDNGTARLSMHSRVWNPTGAPYNWLAAFNDDGPPVEALTVVAAHLLGAARTNPEEPNGLFIGHADKRAVVCAREPRSGLILGLTEEEAVRGWEFIAAKSDRQVDTDRLLGDARFGDTETMDKQSSDLRITDGLVLGWPDSLKNA
jgi:hypothetical protein